MEYVLFAASGGFLLIAIALLVLKQKKPFHYFVAVALISLAYVLFYFGAVGIGFIIRVPALWYSDITISFLIAPSGYFFFSNLLSERKMSSWQYMRHFILPVLLFIGFAIFNGRRSLISPGILYRPDARFTIPVLFLFSLTGDLFLFSYNTLTIIHGISLYRRREIKKMAPYRIVMSILFFYHATLCMMLMNYIIRDERIFSRAGMACGGIVLVFVLLSLRMVEYKSGINRLSNYSGERCHAAWDDELEKVKENIRLHLEKREYYRDASYQLKNLAEDVGKPVAQVSYTINRALGISFKAYINGLRIESIARELLEKKDNSILNIAMDNGFNSKSSFNTQFNDKFGMTPREYKKQYALNGKAVTSHSASFIRR